MTRTEVNVDKLFSDYLKVRGALSMDKKVAGKPFVMTFIGLNGVGKTYISHLISKRLFDLPISCNDYVRRFLESQGYSGEGVTKQALRHKIATKESEYFYDHKVSHIIDADLLRWYKDTDKVSKQYGFNLLLIHLVCPEKIALERIRKRLKEVQTDPDSNFSRVGEEMYFEREKLHQELGEPKVYYFEIDTSREVDRQLEMLYEKMKMDGYLNSNFE